MCSAKRHVRFTPESGHVRCTGRCPLSANSGHRYSITSSARASIVGGMVRPSVLGKASALSMSMRVMGGRDIIIAAAFFAFYHEVSHLLVFNSFQNAGFAFAT
jgi:hypothetical protein